MCIVSNITNPWATPALPTSPAAPKPGEFWPNKAPNSVPDDWNPKTRPLPPIETIKPEIAQQLLDVIKRLDAIDKALGLLTCKVEKAEKQKIVRKLRRQAKRK